MSNELVSPRLDVTLLEKEMARRMHLGIVPGLERVLAVLEHLGQPHLKLGRVLLVAGTNGKGSTCAFAESILRASGIRSAFYCSPHISRFTERIRVAGEEVALETLQPHLDRVLTAERSSAVTLTGFELVTAVAFDYFASLNLDYSVVEVGLGGRLDATNVVDPAVTIITSIGMDHMEFLGDSLESVASEKAGIIRPGVPCVAAGLPPQAHEVISSIAAAKGAPLELYGDGFTAQEEEGRFNYQGEGIVLNEVNLGLKGDYQIANAALSVRAATHLASELLQRPHCIVAGLERARWPGRFDERTVGGLQILFDGAHNVPGVQALVGALRKKWPGARFRLLFGSKAGKDTRAVLELLAPLAASVVLTSLPDNVVGVEPAAMAAWLPESVGVECVQNPEQAMKRWLEGGQTDELRLCCGSLYLVGYCLTLLAWAQ